MKQQKIKKIIVCVFIVLLLIVVGAFGMMHAQKNDFLTLFGVFVSDSDSAETQTSEITVEDEINKIDIEWIGGNVTVVCSDDDKIHFEESSAKELSYADSLVYKINGDVLNIDYCKSSLFGLNISVPDKTLIVKIPEKQYKAIIIDTVSAKIDLNGLNADKFDIETVSGSIEMTESAGEFIEVDTVSGNADIYLPADVSFAAEFDSVSGAFNTDFSVSMNNDTYTCGDGKIKISADTVSGNISVLKKQ